MAIQPAVLGLTGGGIRTGFATLINSTLSGNSTSGDDADGGGIEASTVILTNSTVSGNSASGDLAEAGGIDASSTVLTNSIVLGNTASDVGTGDDEINGFISGNGVNIVGGDSAAFDASSIANVINAAASDVFAATVDNNGVDAGVLADNGGAVNTIALLANADNPALDVGNAPDGVTTDANGNARDVDIAGVNNGGTVDAGAVELAALPETPSLEVTTTADVVDAFDGETSLREAIAFANSDADASAITFASGVGEAFENDALIRLTQGELAITQALTIDGSSAGGTVVITGDADNDDVVLTGTDITDVENNTNSSDNSRIISITGGTTTLESLTITGGVATGSGVAGIGGGVYGASGVTVMINNSTIAGNNANYGGGVFVNDTAMVTNSTVSGNSAGDQGGGIFSLGSATLTNSTLSDNNADGDGGGVVANAIATLINSTLTRNSAGDNGGGVYANTATLTNSTITGNSADNEGGGIFAFSGLATLNNSIVLGNGAMSNAEIGGSVVNNNSLTTGSVADIFAATAVGADGVTLAGVLADNGGDVETIALLADTLNPALDVGDTPIGITLDANGNAREVDILGLNNGGLVDAGAVEVANFVAEADSLIVTTTDDVVDAFDGETSLREAIAFANSDTDANTITFASDIGDAFAEDALIRLTQGELVITSDLTIDGSSAGGGVVITGDANGDDVTVGMSDITDVAMNTNTSDNSRVLNVTDGIIALDSLTITGGYTSSNGGGINGGSGVSVTLTNSTLSGNSARIGGGVYAPNTATLTNSTLSGNSSVIYGGGVFADRATVTNTTVSGNSTAGFGGGIYANLVTLTNSTVSGNSSSNERGGISSGTTELSNSIVLGNTATFADGEIAGSITNGGGTSIVGADSTAFDASMLANIINANPNQVFAATIGNSADSSILAGVLADNGGPVQTIAILHGGLADDAGDNAALPADTNDIDDDGNVLELLPVDARGFERVSGAAVDIGAVELLNDPTENADFLVGLAGDDTIDGLGGSDTILGLGGNDELIGGNQNDILDGGVGNDTLVGNLGRDSLTGGSGNDLVLGGNRDDTLNGNDGDDRTFGGSGNDEVFGGSGVDTLRGGNNEDTLDGGLGDDFLFGGTGIDTLIGGDGNDLLDGRGGFDRLEGGAGDDTLTGGFNADTFVFTDGFGNDVITDFAATSNPEKIDLSGVAEIVDFTDLVNNHLTPSGMDAIIADGLGNTITLTGVNINDLDAADFIF